VKGLAFETSGWLGLTFGVTIGAGVDVYTFEEDALSAVSALDLLVAWLNDAARPWTGAATFAWEKVASADRAMVFQLVCDVSVDAWDYAAGIENKLSFPTGGDTTTATLTATAGALATVDIDAAVVDYWRNDATAGIVSGSGALRFHSAATSARRPSVKATMTGPAVVGLRVAEFAASVPRRLDVYQGDGIAEGAGGWRRLAVGLVEVAPVSDGLSLYTATFEAIG
jgi:hypothetical protein